MEIIQQKSENNGWFKKETTSWLTGDKEIGLIIDVIPNTAKILKIFDPIKLPTARFSCFLKAATNDVASSGILVPIATKLTEITLSVKPNSCAINVVPSIKKLARNESNNMPAIINRIDL